LAPLEAEELRRICFESGADDVGFQSIDDPEIAAQKADIIKLFPDTRTVVSLLCRMNQEPVRSVVRSVANQEFHETYNTANATARHIVRTLQDQGRRALNAVAAFPMEQDNFPGKTWAPGHKPIAVAAGLGKMGIHRCEPFPAPGGPNRTNLISRLLWQSIPCLCPVFSDWSNVIFLLFGCSRPVRACHQLNVRRQRRRHRRNLLAV
jgi:hypothetical protein